MQILEKEHLAFMRSVDKSFKPTGPYVPYNRNEAYPSHLCRVDFRKLSLKSLMLYVAAFGINVRPDCTRDECATAVACHFVTWNADETAVMKFIEEKIGENHNNAHHLHHKEKKMKISEDLVRDDEEYSESSQIHEGKLVAALVKGKRHMCIDEGWILGRVLRVLGDGKYEINDVDESYTTSFYKASVMSAFDEETGFINVCFDDDLDLDDQPIVRTIRADYIIPLPSKRISNHVARVKRYNSKTKVPKFGIRKGIKSSRAAVAAPSNGSDTYSNRIAHALRMLPELRGSFSEICDIIEENFHDSLNWKLESDARRTPVWKSSVRKILISNHRFKPVGAMTKHVFTFSNPEDEPKG